ncbi:Transcription factor [Macleaya cordata]|uniref:Transcription factor n=1 Tax=Macleaya cordata TaxID=56857 RepID=A0A200QMF1_MACCD|nr:Transcription factor [Macleaya cordata]
MGRAKLAIKKIEDPTACQTTYSKRMNGIIKKAAELSILCNTDVAVIMFSPTGRLTTFSSNGRVENVFLRFFNVPANLRGGFYMPDPENIKTPQQAELHQRIIINALERLKMRREELEISKNNYAQQAESIKIPSKDSEDADMISVDSVDCSKLGEKSKKENVSEPANPEAEEDKMESEASIVANEGHVDFFA